MPKKSKKSKVGGTQPTRTTSGPESYASYRTRKTQCIGHQKPVHDIQSGMFDVAEWTDEGQNSIIGQEYWDWLTDVQTRTNIENNCVCVNNEQCKTKYCEKEKGNSHGKCNVRSSRRSLRGNIRSLFSRPLRRLTHKPNLTHGKKKRKNSKKKKKRELKNNYFLFYKKNY